MAINLKREGIALNAEERNKRNENLTIIEQELEKIGPTSALAELAKLAADDARKVADGIESKVVTAVETADAAKSEAVGAINTANQAELVANSVQKQFNAVVVAGDSGPQATQASIGADGTDYDGNLKARLDAEHNTVTAQLAETGKQGGVDYVKLLREHNEVASNLFYKKTGDKKMEIAIPYKDDLCGYYVMGKDTNDDYIKLKEGSVQSVKLADNVYMKKNYDTKNGSWVTSASPNIYTRVIGDTFSFSFEGTGFAFNSIKSNVGGLWEFDIDSGQHIKQVSVFAPTQARHSSEVIKGLTQGIHNVVATFKGQDPANPLALGTPRGWIEEATEAYLDYQTISVYKMAINGAKKFQVLNDNSNKDFAISLRPSGSTLPTNWIPEHGGIGTVFKVSQEISVDNKLVTDWTTQGEMLTAKSIRFVQVMKGFHSSDLVNHLAEIITVHTFNAEGVSIQGKIKFVQPAMIGSGYVMMFPVYPSFAQRLLVNTGESYATVKTDNTETNINGEPTSFAFVNENGTNGELNTVAAMTVNDPYSTYRKGKEGRRFPFLFINHRDVTIQKLYPMIFQNYEAAIGEEVSFGGTYHIGEIPLAATLLG